MASSGPVELYYWYYAQVKPIVSRTPFVPSGEYAVTMIPLFWQYFTSSGSWRYKWISFCRLSGLIRQLSNILRICFMLKFDKPIAFVKPPYTWSSIACKLYSINYRQLVGNDFSLIGYYVDDNGKCIMSREPVYLPETRSRKMRVDPIVLVVG